LFRVVPGSQILRRTESLFHRIRRHDLTCAVSVSP
jgi:hypothetical protein